MAESAGRVRVFTCQIKQWGPDPDVVIADVDGMCGASCGESVRWVLFLEPRIVWDRSAEKEALLIVLRDQPMYAEADIHDRSGQSLGRCGYRFTYDGLVHHLED